MTWRRPLVICVAVLLAAFTDERALIASSLVLLWWWLRNNPGLTLRTALAAVDANVAAVAAAWILYFTLRLGLQAWFGLHTGTEALGFGVLRGNFTYLPFAFLSSIELLWLVVAAGIAALVRQKRFFMALSLCGSVAATQLAAFLVLDITRSAGYVFPAVLVALFVLSRVESKAALRKLMLVVAIGCLLFPNTYVMMGVEWMSPILPKALKLLNP